MKKSRFAKEQIAFALRQAESGTAVADVCRQLGVSEATFYVWTLLCQRRTLAEARVLLEKPIHDVSQLSFEGAQRLLPRLAF